MLPSKKVFQNNIGYISCNDVATICKPLTEHLGIDYFSFQYEFLNWETRRIENVFLCNSHEQLDIFYERYRKLGDYKIDATTNLANYQKLCGKYLLDSPEMVALTHEVYGIHNVLRKLESAGDNEWLRFIFATKSHDTKYLNLYLNNKHLLDKFILYFRDRAEPLITKAINNKVLFEEITTEPELNARVNCLGETSLAENYTNFLKSIEMTHYSLANKQGGIIKVPRGEMLCLQLLARGRNTKEIAIILGISSRTVESNINNSRRRLHCFSRRELLDLLELNNVWSKF